MNFNKDEPFVDPNDYYVGKKARLQVLVRDDELFVSGKKYSWRGAMLKMSVEKKYFFDSEGVLFRMLDGVLEVYGVNDGHLAWYEFKAYLSECKNKEWYLAVPKKGNKREKSIS